MAVLYWADGFLPVFLMLAPKMEILLVLGKISGKLKGAGGEVEITVLAVLQCRAQADVSSARSHGTAL